MEESLADKIEERIRAIPAGAERYATSLKDVIGASRLRRIALEAADVAREHYKPRS